MKTTIVANIPHEFQFISDSQDTASIKEYLGEVAAAYDAFFVRVSDGDYDAVYGIVGIIPYKSKLATLLT